MPEVSRFNEIIRRPIEVLRHYLWPSSHSEKKFIEIFVPEAFDRIAERTGMREYGTKVESGFRGKWVKTSAYLTSKEVATPYGLGAARLDVKQEGAEFYFLIPHKKAQPDHIAGVYLDVLNRPRTNGHDRLSQLLYNVFLKAWVSSENPNALPFSIEVTSVKYKRHSKGVSVNYDWNEKGEQGLLVKIRLKPEATEEELEAQSKKIIELILKELNNYL